MLLNLELLPRLFLIFLWNVSVVKVPPPLVIPGTLIAADCGQLHVVGQTQLTLSVGDNQITYSLFQKFAFPVVLGSEFLRLFHAVNSCDNGGPDLIQIATISIFSVFLIRMALLLPSTLLVLLAVFAFLLSRSLFLHYWILP